MHCGDGEEWEPSPEVHRIEAQPAGDAHPPCGAEPAAPLNTRTCGFQLGSESKCPYVGVKLKQTV